MMYRDNVLLYREEIIQQPNIHSFVPEEHLHVLSMNVLQDTFITISYVKKEKKDS